MKKIVIAAALVVAWAQVSDVQAFECKEKMNWKLGFNTVEDSLRGAATKALKRVVETETDGCVTIQIFPGEALGTEQEMIEAVQINALDITMSGGSALSNVDPLFGATTLPFMFNSFEEAQKVINGPFGERLRKLAAANNLHILTFGELGFAQITNNARPIKSADDVYGLKMRSPKENTLIKTFELLGASVTPMPFSEVYLGLSQGVVDGQFNPLDAIYENKFHEVQKYLAVVNIFYYNTAISMSKKLWDGLDAELRDILVDASKAAQKASFDYAKSKHDSMLDQMKSEFDVITQPDTDPFRAKTAEIYDDFQNRVGDISDLLKAIEEYRQKN